VAVPRVAGLSDSSSSNFERPRTTSSCRGAHSHGSPSPPAPVAAPGSVRFGPGLGSATSRRRRGRRPFLGGRGTTDDVADLGVEFRVSRELERLGPPRLQSPFAPHLRHSDVAHLSSAANRRRPVRHAETLRRRRQRRQHDLDLIEGLRATRTGPVIEGVNTALP